jgi:WhiB family redox-sensing transcriptional regulator
MSVAVGVYEETRRVGRIRTKTGVRYDQESWRAEAACRDVDAEIFFPVGMTGSALLVAEEAKAICARCPVRLACLEFALNANQQFGIWGGYDEEERRELRRRRRRTVFSAQRTDDDEE